MNFKKDLLIIDTEFSGFDLQKHELLQIAAVQLDRKTLKEKKHFVSYIKPTKWKHRDAEAMAVNHITLDMLKNAPTLREVMSQFDKAFKPDDVMLASYTGYADKKFLLDAYEKTGLTWKFDYHYFDVWSAAYVYLAANDKLTSRKDFAGFGLDSLQKMFDIHSPALHDALVDCRFEAEVLRKVISLMRG